MQRKRSICADSGAAKVFYPRAVTPRLRAEVTLPSESVSVEVDAGEPSAGGL